MHCVQAKKEWLQADRNLRSMLNHTPQLFLIRTLLISSFFPPLFPLKKKKNKFSSKPLPSMLHSRSILWIFRLKIEHHLIMWNTKEPWNVFSLLFTLLWEILHYQTMAPFHTVSVTHRIRLLGNLLLMTKMHLMRDCRLTKCIGKLYCLQER